MTKTLTAALGAALLAGFASAQFTVDGTKDAAYPGSNQFQTNGTGFGDNSAGNISTANGSELDGVFASINNGNLNILFTGNLHDGNRLELFFDTDINANSVGQNVLRADNADVSLNGLNRMAGLTFDAGFSADYYLTASITNDGNGFLDYATLPTNGAGTGGYLGQVTGGGGNGTLSGSNDQGVLFAYNNSNIAGVTNSSATGASTVTTGFEFQIPLSLLGNVSYASGFRLSAFINNGDHSFLSNQVLGGLPDGTANLQGPASVNFANVAGNQFFAVPEPASMAALGLGLFGVLARKRKKSA